MSSLRGILPVVVLVATTSAATAHADQRSTCATTSEEGQALRLAGKLLDAKKRFVECARSTCPALVAEDCNEWVLEVDKALPTVVVDVRDAAGADVTRVRVFVDNVLVRESLDGSAFPVDPGVHEFRLETDAHPPISRKVVVREGEKARSVAIKLAGPDAPASGAARAEPAPPPAHTSSPKTAAFVIGAVGVVALGAFGVLALTGQSKFDECEASRACTESEKDALRTQRTMSWVALGVGVVGVGVATWLFLKPSATSPASASLGVQVQGNDAATAALRVRF